MELRNQPVQGVDVVMETEGHIASRAIASATRTLRSQSPSACQYVHRTGPGRPSCCPSGPGEEGRGRTLTMHDTKGVRQRHSTAETLEPGAALPQGGGGGKAVDQGEHVPIARSPDAEPGACVAWVGACASSSKAG